MDRRQTLKIIGAVLSGAAVPGVGIAQTRKYLMATGSVGGTFYPLGAAISKVVSQHAPGVEISIQSTGASVENARLLGSQKVEFALIGGPLAKDAYDGKDPFTKAYPNIRAIGYVYPDVVQLAVIADSNINNVQDMKGKRIGVGPIGGGIEVSARNILETAGLLPADYSAVLLPIGQSADRMRDRQLDVVNFFMASPSSLIIDLSTLHNVRLIPVAGDLRTRLQAKYPGRYINITIPGGTYKGTDKEIETVGFASCLFTREEIPVEDIYEITKAMYSYAEEIAKIHPAGRTIKLEDLKKGITVPFHEGTLKFLKEKGIS